MTWSCIRVGSGWELGNDSSLEGSGSGTGFPGQWALAQSASSGSFLSMHCLVWSQELDFINIEDLFQLLIFCDTLMLSCWASVSWLDLYPDGFEALISIEPQVQEGVNLHLPGPEAYHGQCMLQSNQTEENEHCTHFLILKLPNPGRTNWMAQLCGGLIKASQGFALAVHRFYVAPFQVSNGRMVCKQGLQPWTYSHAVLSKSS